jgi:phenylpropionate dioxygenase-like ring-hydroxylating dioxygenase large terminal subunit
VDRRIFSDPEIYQAELSNIFARAWNFICHESQLAEQGNFFLNYIGEDQVIAVRDRKDKIQVLLNSCPHRGNTVCRAEQGKTNSFFCSYHGWNFDLTGALVGLPGEDKYYHNDLNKAEFGLASAAKVESYKGFVFATLAVDAPALQDYLGWVGCVGLDMLAERGDIEVVDGIQKNRVKCNWKLAVDNLFDWYHPKVSHGSAIAVGMLTEQDLKPMDQMVLLGEYGHAVGGPGISEAEQAQMEDKARRVARGEASWDMANFDDRHQAINAWRANEQAKLAMGPVGVRSHGHPNIFPNVWISTYGSTQLCLRIPRGPLETELWWFTLVEKSMPAEQRRLSILNATHGFGPAGLLEQDDGENWSHSTRGSLGTVTQKRSVNFSMGHGRDEMLTHPSGQSSIDTVINEHAQLWTYQSWQDWMHADSWAALTRDRSQVPTGVV